MSVTHAVAADREPGVRGSNRCHGDEERENWSRSAVPEVSDVLCRKICRDLGVSEP